MGVLPHWGDCPQAAALLQLVIVLRLSWEKVLLWVIPMRLVLMLTLRL